MRATHAISKIEQKSQNRILRELDQKSISCPGIQLNDCNYRLEHPIYEFFREH